MSEAIKIDKVNGSALVRVCAELQRMSDADLDALCLMIEAEMTARKEHDTSKRTVQNNVPIREP